MGHIRIGTLPATRRWQDVIGLISEGAEAPRLAEAVTHAWEKAFNAVRSDAGFREAVWLLMQLGAAGKGRDPTGHKTTDVVLKHYFRPGQEDFRQALEGAMPKLLTVGEKQKSGNQKPEIDVSVLPAEKTAKQEMRELLGRVKQKALREELLKVWAKW